MKRRGKNKWKQAVSMCLVFQMAVTSPAAAVTLPAGKQQSKFNTGQYAAVLDPSAGGGSLALFNGSGLEHHGRSAGSGDDDAVGRQQWF